jgi:hypothetical protein
MSLTRVQIDRPASSTVQEVGASVAAQKFFLLVPFFWPTPIAKTLNVIEGTD